MPVGVATYLLPIRAYSAELVAALELGSNDHFVWPMILGSLGLSILYTTGTLTTMLYLVLR
jgi:hypothetical protein